MHGAIEATGPGDLVVFPDCQGDADERPSPAARWSRCCPARTSEASRLGIAAKGRRDCGRHEWYREHDDVWRCYHCEPGEYVGEDPYVNEALRDLG